MKTLIIHPDDRTTDFLRNIYNNVEDKTIVTGGFSRNQLKDAIKHHDRILMLGHGCPAGLFRTSQAWGDGISSLVIDEGMVEGLMDKDCIFIWCNADQFVHNNRLHGLCTGMFISEVDEAMLYNFPYSNELKGLIHDSNYGFSNIVGSFAGEPLHALYKHLMKEYGQLAKVNPIAEFNFKRLYLITKQSTGLSNKIRNAS